MRIISNFHDYYDGALKVFNNDPIPVYNRETKYTFIDDRGWNEKNLIYNIYYNQKDKRNWEYSKNDLIILGVCGKLHIIYYANDYNLKNSYEFIPYRKIGYDGEDILHEKDFHQIKLLNTYFPKKKEIGWYVSYNSNKSLKETCLSLKRNKNIQNIFFKYNVPIFLYKPQNNFIFDSKKIQNNLVLNPSLNTFDFSRIVDPYTLCQELDMFLNNDLVKDKQPKIPVGTDVQLAESKGFDKWSFRKKKENK